MFEISHRSHGKITDLLASTLARTTAADTLVNYSLMYVPQRPVISHSPDGNIAEALASTLACAVQLLWRTCGRDLKFPIAPMGKCLVDMSISSLIFYDGCCLELPGWSTC